MAATATRSAKTLLLLGLGWVGLYWWSSPTVPGLVLASIKTNDPASQTAAPNPDPTRPADPPPGSPGLLEARGRVGTSAPDANDSSQTIEPSTNRADTPSDSITRSAAHAQPASDPPQPALAFETYTVKQGDTLTRIAKARYGSVRFAQMIYRANRDRLAGPDTLSVGQQLRLPTDARAWARAHTGDP